MNFRLWRKRAIWLPTWRGWLGLLVIVAVAAVTAVHRIHPFLAVTRPVPANVLVIEGWIGDTSLQSVAGEIRSTNYEWIFTSGIPLENGSYLVEYRTHAEVAAHTLVKMGLPAGKVLAAPAPETRRDRTFSSAVAVADAVRAKGIAVRGINVISEGPHARRTRRAYERAFDGEMAIGIIATAPRDYDATHWWRYSEGIKTVISETAALVGDVLFPVTR